MVFVKCSKCGMFRSDDSCQYCLAGDMKPKGYTPPKDGVQKSERRKQMRAEHSPDKCGGKCQSHRA